jgi:NAD(P)-dependent dehydrogenase (short-subunit alcohol dehydrogenase family)
MTRLLGKIAVVTGAGSGIGRASAIRFAQEGATVLVTSRSRETAAATAQAIVEAGGNALSLSVDVSKDEDVRGMIAMAQNEYGRIDILFNNAMNVDFDAAKRDNDFLEFDADIFMSSMRGHVLGGLLAAKYALPAMLENRGGSIIFNSSIASLDGPVQLWRRQGCTQLVRQVDRSQFWRLGIRCNAILPGVVKSPSQSAWVTPEIDAVYLDAASSPRLGLPEDIAAVAAFLASDEAA